MAAQIIEPEQKQLFKVLPYITGKKRARYKTPTYTKSYTFYHINPDTGEIQYDGDERHIFRIKTLHKLYSLIYGYCNVNIFERFESKKYNGLTIWGEDKQAEITNTYYLSIKDRLKTHIQLLRLLRKGFSIKESLERIINGQDYTLE